jgi:hypothetical protein
VPVSEKVTRKVQYCEMVPYTETVKVAVGAPCATDCCDRGCGRSRLCGRRNTCGSDCGACANDCGGRQRLCGGLFRRSHGGCCN